MSSFSREIEFGALWLQNMTSGANNFNYFLENKLTKFSGVHTCAYVLSGKCFFFGGGRSWAPYPFLSLPMVIIGPHLVIILVNAVYR